DFIAELSEESDRTEMEVRVMDALKAQFRPEFLNRVDDVIIYHQLERSQIGHIAEIQIDRVKKLLAERRLELDLSDRAKELLADRGYDPQYGARPLKRVIQRMVQDPLAIQILEGHFPEGSKILGDIDARGDALEFTKS
ncbi:MAG: ATP-dependent chaperone ClpB, partial [Deltaproteobacteria bacterium]|nr:ATP-dependent chaperone ClpB [Deltaproteobacteria bacterium]